MVELEQQHSREAARGEFQSAWRLYHDHLTENGDQAVDAIEATWPAVSPFDHVSNLLAVANLLRRAGRERRASEYIDQWIDQRSGERLAELDLRELQIFGQINDVEFLAKLDTARTAHRPAMSLSGALDSLGRREYMDEAIDSVARARTAELVRALEENPGDSLSAAIVHCLELSGRVDRPVWVEASGNMREALLVIAGRSRWSADRVRFKYGIELAEGGE